MAKLYPLQLNNPRGRWHKMQAGLQFHLHIRNALLHRESNDKRARRLSLNGQPWNYLRGCSMKENLIAPCGMNCRLCVAYLFREKDLNKQGFHKKSCSGCIPRGEYCTHMGDQCELVGKGKVRYCFECEAFPCKRLKLLDKRYRTKYHMSMIENLEFIKEYGMEGFLKKEEEKWCCPECGEVICCHNGLCLTCNLDALTRNKKYRWNEE